MICESCGGEYPADALACPYCGTENEAAADKHKEAVLSAYDTEAVKIRSHAEKFPKQAGRRYTKYILLGTVVLLVLCVVAAIGYILAGKLGAGLIYQKEQRHIEQLEALFQKEDYSGIHVYLEKRDLWDRVYDKYRQVAEVYENRQNMDEMEQEIEQIIAEGFSAKETEELCTYWLETWLEYAARVLQDCEEYGNDTVFLQNEEALRLLEEECTVHLAEMGLTEQEISMLLAWDRTYALPELLEKLKDYYGIKADGERSAP